MRKKKRRKHTQNRRSRMHLLTFAKKCGACEKACPQGLSIRADLEKVAKELNTEEA